LHRIRRSPTASAPLILAGLRRHVSLWRLRASAAVRLPSRFGPKRNRRAADLGSRRRVRHRSTGEAEGYLGIRRTMDWEQGVSLSSLDEHYDVVTNWFLARITLLHRNLARTSHCRDEAHDQDEAHDRAF
jgi:hypothetical protein